MKLNRLYPALLLFFAVLSAAVYAGAFTEDIKSDDDAINMIVRLFGYIITLAVYLLDAASLYSAKKSRVSLFISHILSTAAIMLLLAYDIISAFEDINPITGMFPLEAFLIMDVLILTCCILLFFNANSKIWLCASVILIIYCVGEFLGYPTQSFSDWDETFLIFSLVCNSLVHYFYVKNQSHTAQF